jgi:thiol-disulfide isomerase/thioredoxin
MIGFIGSSFLSCSSAKADAPRPVQALFSAKFPDSQGKMQALDQWKGKIIVVNFWATWCPPCRAEMPELSDMQDKYAKQDLIILGIATDDVDKIHEFTKTTIVSYSLLAGDMDAMNLSSSLGNNRGVLPFTVVLDRNGHIVKTFWGRVNQSALEETLQPLFRKDVKQAKNR